MDTIILIALNLLPIAVVLALWPWFKRRYAKGQRLSNVTTVTIMAVAALICLGVSHLAMHMKILTALLVVSMWFLAYRFREQGPVVGAVLVGLAAIMILSGLGPQPRRREFFLPVRGEAGGAMGLVVVARIIADLRVRYAALNLHYEAAWSVL